MKKIILIITTILSINVTSQEIHSKEFYKEYYKNINKLELFLKQEGYVKKPHTILYESRENTYNYVFTKDDLKIFVLIPNDWLDAFEGIELDYAYCNYFSKKVKAFTNDNKQEIYIIKRG